MKKMNKFYEVPAFAHRGLHNINDALVENSPSAITRAIDAGFGIEIDVQMSRDLIPMVFHDETLERLTGRKERLNFLSAGELSEVSYSVGGDKLISLEDCLLKINGAVPLLIEVKSHWTGNLEMEASILEICEQYDGPHGIMSFDPGVIKRFKDLNCRSPLGLVTSQCPPKRWSGLTEEERALGKVQFDQAKQLKVDFLAHDIADIANEYVSALVEELDIPLFSWTITSLGMLEHAKQHEAIPIAEFHDLPLNLGGLTS